MNELSSLGLILLLALMAGHLVKFIRVPEVTGYLLAGVALGPSVLGWVSHENLTALEIFSEVALGLILFSIGSVFEFGLIQRIGRNVLLLTLIESLLACATVIMVMLLGGQQWQVALLLGVIAMETAAASTLMVMRECNAEGPLTETLTGIIALNNIFCLVGFGIASAVIGLASGAGEPLSFWEAVYTAVYPPLWRLVGSVALGYLIGLMLAAWASQVHEHGEMLLLLTGCILLCVGVSILLDVSSMIASLAVGATLINLSARTRQLFKSLSRTDPPLYAIFFVIAGADLDITLLGSIGALGLLYVGGRALGKVFGARWGARKLGLSQEMQRWLGLGLMAQAGLAIGLTLIINRQLPEYAPVVTTIVLSSVIIYEIVGPISARFAIMGSGESHPHDATPIGVLD